MTKTRKPREIAKYHDAIANHANPSIRLASDYVAEAAKAAKTGNVEDFLTFIGLAKLFIKDVNFNNPAENFR